MKKYVFASMLLASVVVSVPSHALVWGCPKGAGLYYYGEECHNCPQTRPIWDGSMCCEKLDSSTGKCPSSSGTTTKCTSKQYMLNGKCMDCQKGGVCDGTNMKCTYGSIKSNGFVSCNTAPGINPSCVNYIVKDGKCADISEMCPKGQTAKADSSGRVTCTTPSILACKTNYYIVNNACVSCPTYGKCDGKNVKCPGAYTKDSKGAVTCTGPCEANMYLSGGDGIKSIECTACPANATCNGTKTVTCKSGYTKATKNGVITCVVKASTCKRNQYLVNNKCATCPVNATCNGKTAVCKSGYTKAVKNGVVTCIIKQCEKGSHDSIALIKKKYKNCTKCRTENIAAGKCAKNKKAHKHYYCMCNC